MEKYIFLHFRMFHARDPQELINWNLYTSSFRMDSWFGSALSLILSTLVLVLIVALTQYSIGTTPDNRAFTFMSSFTFSVLSHVITGSNYFFEKQLLKSQNDN